MNREEWKKVGLKATKNRQEIWNVLEGATIPLTAEDIFAMVSKTGQMNLSTIYRTMVTFSEKGLVEKNVSREGKCYYDKKSEKHSHFLVCSSCSKRVLIEECPIEGIREQLVEQTGFHITGHNLEFFGECKECSERNG